MQGDPIELSFKIKLKGFRPQTTSLFNDFVDLNRRNVVNSTSCDRSTLDAPIEPPIL